MKYPEDFLNKLICIDCQEGMRDIPDGSIDLMVTDPPYGYSFMQRDWDKALVNIGVWQECLRVLKPGAFAFIMCAPRQDVLSRQIINLEEAGFITGFTSLYWTYASGFPKAQNISKAINKKECRRQLTKKLERRPTKEEFEETWNQFGTTGVIKKGAGKNPKGLKFDNDKQSGGHLKSKYLERNAISPRAKLLNGSYGGFQPKPAIEVILVVMKPLSEKTYVDQALKNEKGITWLDKARIPLQGIEEHRTEAKWKSEIYSGGYKGGKSNSQNTKRYNNQGRFPANLLVSNDVLNDGKILISPKHINYGNRKINQWTKKPISDCRTEPADSGSFSRYFDLDKWWEERKKKLSNQPCFICGYIEEHGNYIDADGRTYCDECLISGSYLDIPKLNIKELPKSVQKTFPFLIVPKASKKEKNMGCERLEEKVRANINKMMGEAGSFKTGSGNVRTVKFKNHHPTVKPIKLMSYLIILGSRPNDIALDPFVGSGTTCISAKTLKRRYIGFDDDKEYVEIARCRVGVIEPVLI